VKEVPKEEGAGIWKEVENERSAQVHVTHNLQLRYGLSLHKDKISYISLARASKMVYDQRE